MSNLPIFRKPLSGPGKNSVSGPVTPPPPVTPPWMTRAQLDKATGIHELSGVPTNPRIREFHSHTTLKSTSDEVAWCSSAMCTWLEEVGLPSTRSAAARSWWKYGVRLPVPKPGAIAVLWRGGSRDPDDAGPGHVALYVGPGAREGYVRLLGGNQSDSVTIQEFPITSVFGYRWPKDYPRPQS